MGTIDIDYGSLGIGLLLTHFYFLHSYIVPGSLMQGILNNFKHANAAPSYSDWTAFRIISIL